MICALLFPTVPCSSLCGFAGQLAFLRSTCQAQLTLQGQEQEGCLQEYQGHEDPLLLQLVFGQHHIKAHLAHCVAQYHIGEKHAMQKQRSLWGPPRRCSPHKNSSNL